MWNEAALWTAAKNAGMLVRAYVASASCPQILNGWVDYRRPDVERLGYALAAEHSMRYRVSDFPGLVEEDEVVIEHVASDEDSRVLYRVQSDPAVPDGGTGFEKIAFLTEKR